MYILIHTSDRSNLAKVTNLILSVVPKSSLILCINKDDEVIRILSTRNKPHLKEVYKHYEEISGHDIDEDLDHAVRLKETVQCLCTTEKYFSKVLEDSLRTDVHKHTKKGLIRVIVTRAHSDMMEIKEEFENHHGVSLVEKIEETANGNYKDFLLTLLARGG
ncbi:hypothetical protein ACFX12_039948 [Malus domestica]